MRTSNKALPTLRLTGKPTQIADIVGVARDDRRVELTPEAVGKLQQSRAALESAVGNGRAIYGVNTGFGSLAKQRIEPEALSDSQHNLVRSHAAGVGEPLPRETVRAMLVLLAASLCRGRSGTRNVVVETLAAMLNHNVTPVVPETGSVGASGDLAPLAHAALVLLGEGEAWHGNKRMHGGDAMKAAGIEPIKLAAKEGLALLNGTHLMAAQACLLLADLQRVTDAAVVAAAVSCEACRATDSFLDARVHAARNQVGQQRVAAKMREMLAGSQIVADHKEGDARVQDPYSFRCTPQVVGAAADAIGFVRTVVERELGAVTDNPLVFATDDGGDVVSAGNFHGMPLAIQMDAVTVAISHVAGISERRVFYTLAAHEPETRQNAYLSPTPGLHSGLMIAQYTAAACCNEIAQCAAPASVINIGTSAGIEDYNSFGPTAAKKARRACALARNVIAIELLCATQALETHRPLRSGDGVEHAYKAVRAVVPALTKDRPPAPDIAAIDHAIRKGSVAF